MLTRICKTSIRTKKKLLWKHSPEFKVLRHTICVYIERHIHMDALCMRVYVYAYENIMLKTLLFQYVSLS